MRPDSGTAAGRIEVTCLDMDEAGVPVADYWHTLGADEQARADAFRFPADRRRFIVRRGVLRALLSRHLGCPAAAIAYSQNRFGKPFVAGTELRFNVSSSQGLALFAVTREGEIGCDVERVDPDFDFEEVAERYFAPPEIAELRSHPAPLQRARFFRTWTLKEAYVKCRGLGMSLPLERVSVSPVTGAPLTIDGADDLAGACFDPMPGYQAAVVAEAASVDLRLVRLNPEEAAHHLDALGRSQIPPR